MATLTDAVNQWYDVRTKRLALEKQVRELKATEDAMEAWLVANGGRRAIIGNKCRVHVEEYTDGVLVDFDAFSEFVARNRRMGAFELMHRRLAEAKVLEWWKEGREIPGVNERVQPKLYYRSF